MGNEGTAEGLTKYIHPGHTRVGVLAGEYPEEMTPEEFNAEVQKHTDVKVIGGTYNAAGTRIALSVGGRLIKIEQLGSDGEPATGEERYGVNWTDFDQLTGRLLTLCDATFTDPVQRKAFKDMVRQHIKEWVNGIAVDAAADAGQHSNSTAPMFGADVDTAWLWGTEGEGTE